MFVFLPRLFKKFFSHIVANAARRREARYAEREARRRQAASCIYGSKTWKGEYSLMRMDL